MALFRFKVSTAAGKVETQLVEAESKADAVGRLQARSLIPVSFLGEATGRGESERRSFFAKRFDLVDFTERLVPLLEARVTLEKALGILLENQEPGETLELLHSLRRGLHEGRRFSQMLRDRSAIFPPLYVNLVEVGEEAGALDRVMADLRDFLVEQREMRSQTISAAIYPVVVLAVSMLVLGIMFVVIIPRFAGVLQVAGTDAHGLMNMLLAVSGLIRNHWWIMLLAVLAGAAGGGMAIKNLRIRKKIDQLCLNIPVLKTMLLHANLARMTKAMAILMRSGAHILDTVRISSRVIQNSAVRDSIGDLELDLRKGRRLAAALSQSRYIPSDMIRMLTLGEETGEMPMMLEKLADRYERELRKKMQRTLTLLEPALILSLGLIVAVVVITMFLAILEIQGGI